jgi:hypothetical protein
MEKMNTTRIYLSMWKQLHLLKENPELYVKCSEAIYEYAFEGKEPETDDIMVAIIFDGAKPLLDKYHREVSKKREDGKKGGRPKKSSSPAYDSEAYKAKARGVLEYKRKES